MYVHVLVLVSKKNESLGLGLDKKSLVYITAF